MFIPDNKMSTTATTATTVSPIIPSQELLDSLCSAWEEQQALEWEQEEEILEDEHRYREFARQEEEKKQNAIFIDPPILRREITEDYIHDTPPRLVRQDTLLLPPPTLIRERSEDYIFDNNSFISPDRIQEIQMPGTPIANRSLERNLSTIRPRRLNFN